MSKGFVVLPDAPGIRVTDAPGPFSSPNVIEHPSGRPWLMGEWDPDEILEVTASPVRVVVIGFCPVTTHRLAGHCRRIRTLSEAGALMTQLPGSFHLVAAAGSATHVYGSSSGLRQVFHTRSGHLSIASDRADVLAAMTSAGVDEKVLAARLVCGGLLPPPLSDRSVWAGVSTVPHDHRLVLEPHGAGEERWWHPPEPDVPLLEGAAHVRDALVTAMDGRRAGGGSLGADLSGGMDSTSLCFLAARHTPDLLTFRWGEAEAGNDDAHYAAESARSLPEARHVVAGQHELPPVFAHPDAAADTERPYLFSRTLARVRHSARLLAEHDVRLHIAGHGGDELFGRAPGYLYRLARRHPAIALRHLRGYRALHRWPWGGVVHQLRRRGGVRDWWLGQAAELTRPAPPRRTPPWTGDSQRCVLRHGPRTRRSTPREKYSGTPPSTHSPSPMTAVSISSSPHCGPRRRPIARWPACTRKQACACTSRTSTTRSWKRPWPCVSMSGSLPGGTSRCWPPPCAASSRTLCSTAPRKESSAPTCVPDDNAT